MKAVEGQQRVRNQPTRYVCFHGSNKYTNGSHGTFLFVYFVYKYTTSQSLFTGSLHPLLLMIPKISLVLSGQDQMFCTASLTLSSFIIYIEGRLYFTQQ